MFRSNICFLMIIPSCKFILIRCYYWRLLKIYQNTAHHVFLLFTLFVKTTSWSCVKPKSQCKSAFAVGTSFSSHMISSSLEVIHPNPSMAGLRLAVQTEEKRARLRLHIAPVVACTSASPARFHRPRCQSFFAKSVFNSTSMVSGTRTTSRRLKFLPI